MRPHVIGPACGRVQALLDEAMAEGAALQLPPELTAHAARCPRCGPETQAVQNLIGRLQAAPAGIPLGGVPMVVDAVLARTMNATPPLVSAPARKKTVGPVWVLGQVAAAAAVILLVAGGISYTLLKVNQAVTGTRPAEVVERITAPLRDWSWAKIRNAK